MAITLMRRLERPLLLEGEAGVGKTEVGKALARMLDRPLIRLQCYEGLDANAAVYEWNYQRQLLAIKIRESEELSAEAKEAHVFQRDFLLERPLLKAIQAPEPAVLLIDEIDRADEEFEAYLLEVLSDFQISIPELGTITATSIPWVVLTSNRTRELSDALRRRCLYHYVDYPSEDKEVRIVLARVPGIEVRLAGQVVRFVQAVRREDLRKTPGVAETLDFAAALLGLGVRDLPADPEAVPTACSACSRRTRTSGRSRARWWSASSARSHERRSRAERAAHAAPGGLRPPAARQRLHARPARGRGCAARGRGGGLPGRRRCGRACARCCARASATGGGSTSCTISIGSRHGMRRAVSAPAAPAGRRRAERAADRCPLRAAGAGRARRRSGRCAPEGRGGGASAADSLAETDLRHIDDPDELERLHALAERLAARMRHRLARRERAHRRGRRLDFAASSTAACRAAACRCGSPGAAAAKSRSAWSRSSTSAAR